MNYYFISDNSWFLKGLREDEANFSHLLLKGDAQFHYTHTNFIFDEFDPVAGDIIILNIRNINTFSHIMSNDTMAFCRLIIMLSPQLIEYSGIHCLFPVFIPDNINTHVLMSYVEKATDNPINFKKTSAKEMEIFKYVRQGYSVTELSALMNIHEKSVYQTRSGRLMKYGFKARHPLTFFISGEVLKVSSVFIHSD